MCDDMQQTLQWMSDALEAARAEVAEAKMPCGHPHGCVVSASHAPEVMTTCHCGWCASIARAEVAEKQLAEAQGQIAELERLVPDADLVIQVLRDNYTTEEMKGLLELSDAIGKYREAQDES